MTGKRLILLVLTIISLIPILFSLINSINQPQVQANLQLYQTNLILQASEFSWESPILEDDNVNFSLTEARKVLIGKDPYKLASQQYQVALENSQESLKKLEDKFEAIAADLVTINTENSPITSSTNLLYSANQEQLKTQIKQQQEAINKLQLKLGILKAQQGKIPQAFENWQSLLKEDNSNNLDSQIKITANTLKNLWNQNSQVLPDAESQIQNNLEGWFRYRCLKKLYQIQDRQADLIALENQQKEKADQAIIKLTLVSIIPAFLGLIGFSLLIFFLLQLLLKKEASILVISQKLSWETPWDAEIIWQVLIVGFFFFGQIIFPILFGLLPLDPTTFSLRQKAFYVLISYLSMTLAGITVLYWSIKSFFPLPKDWFQFKLQSNWILWGIGGYLVALPLVIIVSLINQQIWDGQGGSNPLLFLALEAQDKVVLGIFYFTASLAAPFYEEIMFRGFLLPSLTRYIPVWGAIGVSSLIFALAHLNLSEVLPLAILGIVLGVVYTRSRNLLSSMLVHSLWNSGTLLSLFLLGSGSN